MKDSRANQVMAACCKGLTLRLSAGSRVGGEGAGHVRQRVAEGWGWRKAVVNQPPLQPPPHQIKQFMEAMRAAYANCVVLCKKKNIHSLHCLCSKYLNIQ